ncbi:MAG TPA: rhomboid family intramembrane serine protease [Anaerolineae bacterium]|nr:rhomboid family intramembrane serine protease [Anaerolineae bacterium]
MSLINTPPDHIEEPPSVCYRHPDKPSRLQCTRCGNVICASCARRASVGYQCPDCVLGGAAKLSRNYEGLLSPFNHSRHQPVFTYLILAIIIILSIMMQLSGGSTNPETLINFGAKYGPLILAGEWWRFFTAMFLHSGIMHLAFNGYILFLFGQEMESIYGPSRFLFIYILSGLSGSLLSFLLRHINEFSIGASGAIFGIMGMNIAFFWLYRRRLGEYGKAKVRQTMQLIGFNLIIGFFLISNINNAAHIGGLIGGAILGYLFAPRYQVDESKDVREVRDTGSLRHRWWLVLLVIAFFIMLGRWSLTLPFYGIL